MSQAENLKTVKVIDLEFELTQLELKVTEVQEQQNQLFCFTRCILCANTFTRS